MKYRFKKGKEMTVQDDDREHMYKDRLYHLIGSDGWVDIKNLSVHIQKGKAGVRVSIYPAEHDGRQRALATCEVDYPKGEATERVIMNRVYKSQRVTR